jgi:1,2-diacylglycerol 3-beta-glucosyltransferase
MSWPGVLLSLLALPVLAACAYLAALAVLAWPLPAPPPGTATRFDVVVPAHDEELMVADTVRSLLALDYPRDRFRVVVVADNSTDSTAARARAAGAMVLERTDPERRGKGYALDFAFRRLAAEGRADAFVVVDADTLASPNLLTAFASRIEAGGRALQAAYGVRNRDASWRTRLLHLAFTLFHDVRSRARERLGVSCGLRGNGMGFARSLLEQLPHDAVSVVEDVEYGVRLGLAGCRVAYVEEARVLGEMPASERSSRSQRSRWEGGRLALTRLYVGRLLSAAARTRSLVPLDLALDLLIPPLASLGLAVLLGLSLSVITVRLGHGALAMVPWGLAALLLGVYLARGWQVAGLGWRGLLDLGHVPSFVAWKLLLLVRSGRARSGEWVRTTRGERDS